MRYSFCQFCMWRATSSGGEYIRQGDTLHVLHRVIHVAFHNVEPERDRDVLLEGFAVQEFEGGRVLEFEDQVGSRVQVTDAPVDRLYLDVFVLLSLELAHDHCLLGQGNPQLRQVGRVQEVTGHQVHVLEVVVVVRLLLHQQIQKRLRNALIAHENQGFLGD